MPHELALKLRSHLRNTLHVLRSKRYNALLSRMSSRLRGDASYEMIRMRLRKVSYLVHPDLEQEFVCHLATKYNTCVYSRLERVACTELFVVERGVVAKRGQLGVAGACFASASHATRWTGGHQTSSLFLGANREAHLMRALTSSVDDVFGRSEQQSNRPWAPLGSS